MRYIVRDFFPSFDKEKNKTLEECIKMHGPQPQPLGPER